MNLINKIDLRSRLFIIFTLVFAVTLGTLVVLLQSSGPVIQLNTESNQAFQEYQYFSRLALSSARLYQSINRYENMGNSGYMVYYADETRAVYNILIDDIDNSYRYTRTDFERNALVDARAAIVEMGDAFTQIEIATQNLSWEEVYALDDEVYNQMMDVNSSLWDLSDQRYNTLDEIQNKIWDYQWMIFVRAGIGLGVFVLLAALALILIHFQVNAPLITLNKAIRQLESGSLNRAPVEKLSKRQDEIGAIAASLLETADQLEARERALEAEAARIKAKIR